MPPEITNRIVLLEDDPTKFWEHNYRWNGVFKGNHEPCVTKNKIGPECPICDSGDKMWPYFIGLHTCVNMTSWFTKKKNREVCFQREIFAAKLGGKDKPGVLKKLERLKQQHGRLRGLVFDVHRPGKLNEGCGDDFSLVEKVEPSKVREFAMQHLSEYAARLNEGVPADKQISAEKLWERQPWEPLNFEELIVPRNISELREMFKRGSQQEEDSSEFSDDADQTDDIPY
jgi:hypothetical protein